MADTSSGVIGGRYRVLGSLGKGAMGLVFMAHDPVLDRKVAIKQMTAEIADNEELRQRFYVEARAAARLNHPNIITIHELQESGGDIFMIMELLEGKSLAALIQAKPVPLPIEATLDVMAQVCDGLDYAHQRTIVHRDIKPANLFLTPSGTVKILDFGIARLGSLHMTAAGALIGTPDYMSPEQIRGDEIDRRTDLWAVGAVLYQLLSGSKPFEGKPLSRLLSAIAQTAHLPLQQRAPSVPKSVSDLVDRLLAKPREGRPATAAVVRDELRAILGRESSASTKATLAEDGYEETLFMAAPPKPATPFKPPTPPPPPVPPSAAAPAPAAAPIGTRPAPPPSTTSQPAGTPTAAPGLGPVAVGPPPLPVRPPAAPVASAPPPPPVPRAAAPPAAPAPHKPPADAPPTPKAAPPVSAAAPARTAPAPPAAAVPKPSSSRLALAVVAIVAVLGLVGVAAGWWLLQGTPSPSPGAEPPAAVAATPPPAAQPPAASPSAGAPTAASEPPPSSPGAAAAVERVAPPSGAPATADAAVPSASHPADAQRQASAPQAEPAGQAVAPSVGKPAAPTPNVPPAAPRPTVPGTQPPARRPGEAPVETGVAAAPGTARPELSGETLDAFKGRTSGRGDDAMANLAAVNRINYVLEQYVRALVNADADALREHRLSPSAEETALMRARELKVRLEDLRVEVNGTDAVARCRRRIDGTADSGARIQQDAAVTFHLTRRAAGWIITEIR